MIGIPLALAVSNAAEWLIHKYVLHGLGRKKGSFFAYHWHEHHREARQHDMRDSNYERPVFGWHAQGKEALGLVGLGLAIAPLLPIAPFFTVTGWYCLVRYYRVHRRAHEDPTWAREHLPWHVDHHLGPDQDKNWCVTKPWLDELVGTRVPYLGTWREERDRARRQAAAAAVSSAGGPTIVWPAREPEPATTTAEAATT